MVLTPAWTSPDMVNPAAPRIANGVVNRTLPGQRNHSCRLFRV